MFQWFIRTIEFREFNELNEIIKGNLYCFTQCNTLMNRFGFSSELLTVQKWAIFLYYCVWLEITDGLCIWKGYNTLINMQEFERISFLLEYLSFCPMNIVFPTYMA